MKISTVSTSTPNYKEWINKILTVDNDPLTFIQIIPHYNIANGRKIDNIIDGLHSMQKPILDRVSLDKKNKKIIYKPENTFAYGILIEYNKISFYLSVPSMWQNWICQRIYSAHTNTVTLLPDQEDYLNRFDKNYTFELQLQPQYQEFKSFITDYRENVPIPSILSCQKDLTAGDKVLLEINSKPVDNMWKENTIRLANEYRKGSIDGLKNNSGFFAMLFKFVDQFLAFVDTILGLNSSKDEDYEEKYLQNKISRTQNELKTHSTQKINYNGFQSQIRILAQSHDPIRQEMFAQTMFVALKDLAEEGDNEFKIVRKIKNKIHRPKVLVNSNSFVLSTKEIGQIAQLPERKWQNEYMVEKIDVQQIELPKELFQGGIPIGEVSWKGVTQTASWNDIDKDISSFPKAVFGLQGYGKTEYLKRYVVEGLRRKHAVFVLDSIKSCEMSTEVLNYIPEDFPEDKIVVLRPCDLDWVIPMAWNETRVQDIEKPVDKYKFANFLTQELILMLNSFVEDNSQKLTPRMVRYLTSASTLVFSQPDTNIVDVLEVLDDYDIRHKFIKKSGLNENNKIIQDLIKLDSIKIDKDGNTASTGTKDQDIKFITDRLDLLLSDFILRQLFLARPNHAINFTKWADEGYLVIIQMPEDDDTNISTIDTLTTFLISKLWLAMQKRKNQRQVDVIVDEIHRFKTAKKQLDNIREHRKRRLCYFFSAHQPSDFGNILNTLKSASASFMLLGTTKKNLEHFEEEIKPFTVEECLKTEKYHAKCIVNYDKNYVTFDAKLPKLVEETEKFKDRGYLIEKCAKKYGLKVDNFF